MLSSFQPNNINHLRCILQKKTIISQKTLALLKRTYFCCGHNYIPTSNNQNQSKNENSQQINSRLTLNSSNIHSYCLSSLQIKPTNQHSHRINTFNYQKRELHISNQINSCKLNSRPIKTNSHGVNEFYSQKRDLHINSLQINSCKLNSQRIKTNSHGVNEFYSQKRDLHINSLQINSCKLNSQPINSNNHGVNEFYSQKRDLHINSLQINSCKLHSRPINSNSHGINTVIKRVHSTRGDQHRQKVVIETSSTPIEKLEFEKVLPIEKEERSLWEKIDPYVKLARWDKPIGVYLLYFPCTWSIALATIHTGVDLETSLRTAGLFLIGAGLMRGAGCTINDMWDKDIDKQVERTLDRPLASGAVNTKQATGFLAIQLSAALAVLLQFNCFSVALGASSMLLVISYPLAKRVWNYPQLILGGTFYWGAPLGYSALSGTLELLYAGALANLTICIILTGLLVISYPLAKRVWNYPQLVLGATFNWGALLGYSALSGTLGLHTLPLYAGALAWTVVYDTIYAHQDKLDDARIGIKSTALTFGANTKPLLSGILLASAAGLLTAGHMAELSPVYDAAIVAYLVHVGRQIYTLDVDNPTDCAKKFKSNSLVGLIILLGIIGGGYEKYLENRKKNEGKDLKENANSCFFS